MEELTKESITIINQPSYAFLLHYNWEKNLIWLSKNKLNNSTLKITTKCVPLTVAEKNQFYYARTDFGTNPKLGITHSCSYLIKTDNNTKSFNYWVDFMYKRYMQLKHSDKCVVTKKVEEPKYTQLSIEF